MKEDSDSITLVVEKKGSQGQPGQSTDNRIRLQLEGDACNGFADMVSKDKQIYVSKDGGSSFSQLTGLDTNSTKESGNPPSPSRSASEVSF